MCKVASLIPSLLLAMSADALDAPRARPEVPDAALPPIASQGSVRVDCSNPRAPVHTIADGLAFLQNARPAVLLVSGTCRENVVIAGLDRVTLQGNPTATIDGGTDPNLDTVLIVDSRSIDLVDLTITGGGDGVACAQCLVRLTRVTLRGSLGPGAVTGSSTSFLFLRDSLVRENGDVGVFVGNGSMVRLDNTEVSGNAADGVFLNVGATLVAIGSRFLGNHGNGVTASLHDSVLLNTDTVAGNDGDGVSLQGGSALRTPSTTIGTNLGHQVRVGDLSFAQIQGASIGSGGTFPDVVCDPAFSAVRGISNSPGATTNCPDEQPRAP